MFALQVSVEIHSYDDVPEVDDDFSISTTGNTEEDNPTEAGRPETEFCRTDVGQTGQSGPESVPPPVPTESPQFDAEEEGKAHPTGESGKFFNLAEKSGNGGPKKFSLCLNSKSLREKGRMGRPKHRSEKGTGHRGFRYSKFAQI